MRTRSFFLQRLPKAASCSILFRDVVVARSNQVLDSMWQTASDFGTGSSGAGKALLHIWTSVASNLTHPQPQHCDITVTICMCGAVMCNESPSVSWVGSDHQKCLAQKVSNRGIRVHRVSLIPSSCKILASTWANSAKTQTSGDFGRGCGTFHRALCCFQSRQQITLQVPVKPTKTSFRGPACSERKDPEHRTQRLCH
jgi:hypothetical protein